MERTLPGGSYTSYRRMLPEGKTEYRSTTVFEDATAQEMMDFYLDDDCRERWDSLLARCGAFRASREPFFTYQIRVFIIFGLSLLLMFRRLFVFQARFTRGSLLSLSNQITCIGALKSSLSPPTPTSPPQHKNPRGRELCRPPPSHPLGPHLSLFLHQAARLRDRPQAVQGPRRDAVRDHQGREPPTDAHHGGRRQVR